MTGRCHAARIRAQAPAPARARCNEWRTVASPDGRPPRHGPSRALGNGCFGAIVPVGDGFTLAARLGMPSEGAPHPSAHLRGPLAENAWDEPITEFLRRRYAKVLFLSECGAFETPWRTA